MRTDEFPGKGAIQADHRFNHCEFKTTTLYHNFTVRSLPNLIYLKENTDYTIPRITKKKKKKSVLKPKVQKLRLEGLKKIAVP